jgi:Arm DNA-binding domain
MLTNAVISASKPREKTFKLADGGGLYLLVTPAGSRWWRLRFRVRGKEQMLSLGIFPDVSLKEARERRDQGRRDLAKGIDPSAKRRAERMTGAIHSKPSPGNGSAGSRPTGLKGIRAR